LYVIPFLFVYFPSLLLHGTLWDILRSTVTAIIGTGAISAGLAGYLVKNASWLERILFIGAGFGLITAFLPAGIAGIALLTLSILLHWRR
jgi:TRAP-type uncharacterized transport system fused permease subunit